CSGALLLFPSFPTRRSSDLDLLDSIHHVCSTVFIRIRLIGPVDNEAFSDNQLAWYEPPIPAVRAVVAVVAHREVVIRRHNDLAKIGRAHVSTPLTDQPRIPS